MHTSILVLLAPGSRGEGSDTSLARDLVVEGGERDAEGLQAAERPLVVHREGVLAHAAKLHHHEIRCEESAAHRVARPSASSARTSRCAAWPRYAPRRGEMVRAAEREREHSQIRIENQKKDRESTNEEIE